MTLRKILIALIAVAGLALIPVASAQAAPIRECGDSGGAYVNLTTRNVSCGAARRIARQVEVRLARVAYPRSYSGHLGLWTIRAAWYTNRYGIPQIDARSTAFQGRVVHFQTDWDYE